MLAGQGKHPGLSFPFAEGDALALPFADDTFDAACSGFMMRNVVDMRAAFAEQARVVKPGGRVVCLEITLPRTPVFGRLFRFYFFKRGAVRGRADQRAPRGLHLPAALRAWPSRGPPELARIMESAGLRDVRYRLAMLGTVAVHWGTK